MKPIAITLVVFLSMGCGTSSEVKRGRLSDAMEKASNEHEGERKTEEFEYNPMEEDDADMILLPEHNGIAPGRHRPDSTLAKPDSFREFQRTPPSTSLWLGAGLGSGALASSDLYGLRSLGITFGGYIDRTGYLEFNLTFANAPVQTTSKLSHSLEGGINILGIGADYKRSLTPSHTFLGISYFGGLSLEIMWWQYRNAIQIPTFNTYETISSDGVTGLDLRAGISLTFGQASPSHFIVEFVPGINFWAFDTFHGFDNDIFSPLPYIALKAKFNIAVSQW